MAYFYVFIGGGLGAVCRYGVTTTVGMLLGGMFPWGTFVVNLVGSLLISALIIFPALSAMRIFKSFFSVTICSAVISVGCAFLGILIAILAGTPVGSTIVAVDAAAFGICSFMGLFTGGSK